MTPCSCKVATVRALAGVRVACGGFIFPAAAPHHVRPPAAVQMAAVPADRLEPPHPPERELAQVARPDTAGATVAGAFRLDDPVLGRLDLNPLA